MTPAVTTAVTLLSQGSTHSEQDGSAAGVDAANGMSDSYVTFM